MPGPLPPCASLERVRPRYTAAAMVLRSKKENLEALRQTGEEMPHTGRYQQAVAVQLF